MHDQLAIGVDLGGTNLRAALVDRDKGILRQSAVQTPATLGADRVLDAMAELVEQLSRQADAEIAGIGIGAPGAINWERTTVSHPPNLSGWVSVNVAKEMRGRLSQPGLTVLVENDANVAGLGSAFFGAGRPYDSFIMVTLGTGVGGAIIYQNRIFRGSTGGAGEIGHMTIDYEGPLARSGVAGAIEAYLGQHFLSQHARMRLLNRTESRIHEMAGPDLEGISPRMLFEAARDGDEAARDVLAWAGHKLGCVLGSAVNLLDIRKIVVGGGVSGAGDFILESARKSLRDYVTPGLRDDLEITVETKGNEVGLTGAAQLVFQVRSDGEDPVVR
jgi:glucokinase